MRSHFVAMAGAFLLAACSAQDAGAGREAGLKALKDADVRFAEETAQRGLEGWLSFFDAQAAIFPESRPIVTGIDAIRRYYAESGFDPGGLAWAPAGAGIASSGDYGYTYGNWELRRGREESGAVVARGKYFTQWKRQPDGSWKVVADIGNVAPPERPGPER